MGISQPKVRVPVCRVVRRARVRIIARTLAAGATDGLTIRNGEHSVDVEVRVDDGEIPGSTLATPLLAEVGVAVLAQDDAGSDTGIGADETCGEKYIGNETLSGRLLVMMKG